MKKILCPTDFSDAAFNAIAYAAKLAQSTGAELILYNVQSMTEQLVQKTIFGNAITFSKVSEELEEQSREIAQIFKISCYAEVEVSASTLSNSIERKAEGYDLIVIGTDGTDDLYSFFAGSNSYHVIRKSKIPVLVIPVECGYSEIRHIVYAFNYLKEQSLPMEQLAPWVNTLHSELSVLQVMEEAHSVEMENELKDLQFIISAAHADVKLNFDTIRSSEIPQSINSYILRNDIDILALCTHHKNFIENIFHKSVIKNISGLSTYPIFVFHH